MPDIEENGLADFLASNSVPEPNSGCTLWTGVVGSHGYGFTRIKGKPWLAHRLSFTVARGPIPCGLHVLHSCDNHVCINPDHLRAGTHQDNMDDKMARGRHRFGLIRGESHKLAKLKASDIPGIRTDPRPIADIARHHGVDWALIYRVKKRKVWAWVP